MPSGRAYASRRINLNLASSSGKRGLATTKERAASRPQVACLTACGRTLVLLTRKSEHP